MSDKQTMKIEYEFSAKDQGVTKSLTQLNQHLDNVGTKATITAKRLTQAGEVTERFSSRINKTGGQINYFTATLQKLDNGLNKSTLSTRKMSDEYDKVKSSNKSVESSLASLNQKYDQIKKTKDVDAQTTKQMTSEAMKLQSQLNSQLSTIQKNEYAIDEMKHKKQQLNTQLIQAELLYGKENEKVKNLKNEYTNYCNQLNTAIQKHKEQKTVTEGLAKAVDSFINRAIPNMNNWVKANEQASQKAKELEKRQKELLKTEQQLCKEVNSTIKTTQQKQNATNRLANSMSDYKYKIDAIRTSLQNERQQGEMNISTLHKYETRVKNCDKTMIGFKRNIDSMKKAQSDVKKVIDEKTQALTKLEKEMKDNGLEAVNLKSDIAKLQQEYNNLGREIERAENSFDMLDRELKDTRSEISSMKQELSGFGARMSELSSHAKKALDGMKSFGEGIVSVGESVTSLGEGIVSLGDKLQWLTTVSVGVFGGAIKSGLDYEKAMADVASTIDRTGMSGSEFASVMAQIEDKVRTLSKNSTFNPKEMAEGMKYLSLA